MFITTETNIFISNTSEAIWDYASDPSNWTASNPHKHIDFTCDSAYSRPAMDVELHRLCFSGSYNRDNSYFDFSQAVPGSVPEGSRTREGDQKKF
jgi:hypothetical protein